MSIVEGDGFREVTGKYAERCAWVEAQLPDSAVACNCARCGILLVAGGIDESKRGALEKPAGRVYDRPYCRKCIKAARAKPKPPEYRFRTPDPE